MEYRWSIESDEKDFEGINRLYRSEPSRVAYRDAVGIENIVGMRPRMDMD